MALKPSWLPLLIFHTCLRSRWLSPGIPAALPLVCPCVPSEVTLPWYLCGARIANKNRRTEVASSVGEWGRALLTGYLSFFS